MTPPTFRTLAEYDSWWRVHGVEHNRLAVTDPAEWERVAREVERQLAAIRQERP